MDGFLLKWLYQAPKVSSHVFVCYGYQYCLFFFYDFDIFWNCSDSVVFFFLCFSVKHYIYTILAPVEFSAPDELNVPHSLTLIEDLDQICVADREHGR
jgi:hypothetical protein